MKIPIVDGKLRMDLAEYDSQLNLSPTSSSPTADSNTSAIGITVAPKDSLFTSSDKESLVQKLRETPFLCAVNAGTRQKAYMRPEILYFRSQELETYFEGNPGAWFVDESFPALDRLRILGIERSPRVHSRKPNYAGYVILTDERGRHERGINGFDPECEIDGLGYALAHPTRERSVYIWNRLLLPNARLISGIVESSSRQTFEGARREEKSSKMGLLLFQASWLPTPSGEFRKPPELSLDDLPEEFNRDEALAKLLGMKSSSIGTLAKEAGIKVEVIEAFKKFPHQIEEFIRSLEPARSDSDGGEPLDTEPFVYSTALEQAFARPGIGKETPPSPLPGGHSANPTERLERIVVEVHRDIDNELPREERFRKVPTRQWEAKDNRSRDFLREEYGGKCQICGETFLRRNGQPYFEGLYLVSYTSAGWIDREGNVLCLCANCCAKFMHGSVEAHDVLDQISEYRSTGQARGGEPVLRVKLCGKEIPIQFTERHMLDLQGLLKASGNLQQPV